MGTAFATLRDHPAFVASAALVGLVVIGWASARVDPAMVRRVCVPCGALYLCAVLAVTLHPLHTAAGFHGTWNLVPGRIFAGLVRNDETQRIQALGNLAMFAPLGVLLSTTVRDLKLRSVAVLSAGLSLAIEVSQYGLGTGRAADVDDVIVNTVGAVCGAVLVKVVARRFDRGRFRGRHPAVVQATKRVDSID